jgi:hypothetical protein
MFVVYYEVRKRELNTRLCRRLGEDHRRTNDQPTWGKATDEPTFEPTFNGSRLYQKSVYGCPTCQPQLNYFIMHVSGCLTVQQCLKRRPCSTNFIKQESSPPVSVTFSFSWSTGFHPTNSISLSFKCIDSPSVVSKSSSVTTVTCQISLSSTTSVSSSSSVCTPGSSLTRIDRLTVSCLQVSDCPPLFSEQPPLTLSFSHTTHTTVTLSVRYTVTLSVLFLVSIP